jgi:hypothetical protein
LRSGLLDVSRVLVALRGSKYTMAGSPSTPRYLASGRMHVCVQIAGYLPKKSSELYDFLKNRATTNCPQLKWIERSEHVSLNELFDRMTPQKLTIALDMSEIVSKLLARSLLVAMAWAVVYGRLPLESKEARQRISPDLHFCTRGSRTAVPGSLEHR